MNGPNCVLKEVRKTSELISTAHTIYHGPTSTHIDRLAITEWQPQLVSYDIWYFMTSHEDHSHGHGTLTLNPDVIRCLV